MAKKQVGIPLTECANDDWLRLQLSIAEQFVLNIETNNGADPLPTPPDFEITGSILLVFGELWRHRGDAMQGEGPEQSTIMGSLSPQIARLIWKRRPPSLA